jgi:hypothetical protein
MGPSDESNVMQDIMGGIYLEKQEVYGAVRQAVEEFVEEFDHPQCGSCEAYTTALDEDEECFVCREDDDEDDDEPITFIDLTPATGAQADARMVR